MFSRREPLTMYRKVRGFIWPEMGWRRATRYVLTRIGRLPGSGTAIAGGFAWGAAMSFTPFIGLHIVFSIFGAWVTRCSAVAAAIGTIIGNPWTFPFIWIWLYKFGVALGFGQAAVDADKMDFSTFFANISDASMRGEWSFIFETAMPVLKPMLVASVPTAGIVWVIFFLLLKPVIGRYKKGLETRRQARTMALIESVHQS